MIPITEKDARPGVLFLLCADMAHPSADVAERCVAFRQFMNFSIA